MTPDELKAKAARTWFGYGRWAAPYWFVGKEPGGKDDHENYASWYRLGGHDLIDCREHDLDYRGDDAGKWHVTIAGKGPKLQPTWRPLIALLLSYLGADRYDKSRIREYQVNRWGRLDGDTCILELSGKFVHFYGTGHDPIFGRSYVDYWREIAGAALVENEPMMIGKTTYVYTRHPTSHGITNDFWTSLGCKIRQLSDPDISNPGHA